MKIRLLLMLCGATLGASAQSLPAPRGHSEAASSPADPATPTLKPSPDMTILGLNLGQEFSTQFSACDLNKYRVRHKGYCFIDGRAGILLDIGDDIKLPSYIKHGYRFRAIRANGKFEGVMLPVYPLQYDQIHDVLVAKYGPPTSTQHHTIQNRMGASFDAVTETWIFSNLRVQFDSKWDDLDTGQVAIISNAGLDEQARRELASRAAEPKL